MSKCSYGIACFLVGFLVSSFSFAQEGFAEFPSVSAEAGHVYISNRTNQEIVFYLESENTDRTEHRLGPGMGATYSGESSDRWFNVEVFSGPNNHRVHYGVDAGTRHYIAWSNNILDAFLIPPK